MNFELGWYFDLIEKIFKVFAWTDSQTSDLFLWILIALFIVVTFVPIRPFIAFGLIAKFSKESKFYKRRYISNNECALIAIRNFFYYNECYSFESLFKSD